MKSIRISLTYFLVMFIMVVAVLFSCKKDDAELNNDFYTQSADNALIDAAIDEAVTEAEAGVESKLFPGTMSALAVDCRNIEMSGLNYPKTLTIDFGTNGCTGKGLRVKTGKILVNVSDKPWKAGSKKTITFENFKVNGYKIEGTKTVTYKGFNQNGQPWWEIAFDGNITLKKDSVAVLRKFNRTRTMTNGFEILVWNGDSIAIFSKKQLNFEFELSGSGSGTTRNGKQYTDVITKPLVFNHNCKHIKSGEVEVTISGLGSFTLSYENEGNCSGKAVIRAGELSKEIKLE